MAAGPAPANLNLFFTIAEATIGKVYTETDAMMPDVWKEYSTEVPFATLQHVDGWMGMLPKARMWVGPRVVHEPAPQTYAVLSRPYEHTAGIDRFIADADIFGVFADLLPFQARQLRRHPSYWTRDLIEGLGFFAGSGTGVTNPQLGTDGLTFFNTAHLQGVYQPTGPTYCNDFTGGGVSVAGGAPGGTGTNVTVGGTFSPTAFMTLTEYMMQYRGEDGEPLGVMPTKSMFPAALYGESNLVLKAASFAPPQWGTQGSGSGSAGTQVGAADNPLLRYGVTPFINRFLTNGQKWYLFDDTLVRKPLGWGVHRAPVAGIKTSESDESVFMNHRYLFGWWGHATPFWGGFPWTMSRSGP